MTVLALVILQGIVLIILTYYLKLLLFYVFPHRRNVIIFYNWTNYYKYILNFDFILIKWFAMNLFIINFENILILLIVKFNNNIDTSNDKIT